MSASGPEGTLERVAAWRPDAAVVVGSGLAALPEGAALDDELGYEELGWPCTQVPGHLNRLRLVRAPSAGGWLRLAFACGRPHRYEGFAGEELERPVRALAAAGVPRIVLTNSCGSLRPELGPGAVVVCTEVVDLQRPPDGEEPERLPVCGAAEAAATMAALTAAVAGTAATPTGTPASAGVYVAVLGPQFETPAEVAWLAGYGHVVGMSAAPEVRAARAAGATCALLALVANRAAAAGSHDEVIAAGGRLAASLASGLTSAVRARWPDVG